VVAGKPKIGKPTVIAALIDAVELNADRFLGRQVHGGPVVLLSEEGDSTLLHKLTRDDAPLRHYAPSAHEAAFVEAAFGRASEVALASAP
jgi:hypothetical protein